jgi:hypothetical protein
MRISFNRKRGVAHWFEPTDGEGCGCPGLINSGWTYVKGDKSTHVTEAKISEWNTANPMKVTP